MAQREGTGKQAGNSQRRAELQTINIQRNPYLAEYETQRKTGRKYTAPKHRLAKKRKQARRRRMRRMVVACICVFVLCAFLHQKFTQAGRVDGSVSAAGFADTNPLDSILGQKIQGLSKNDYLKHPTWTEDFLTPNEYSRPGDALKKINSVFVHYTANPGTSAAQNRSYFEQQKDTHERSVSSHFIIGYEGEIIQCVPLDEIAYAVQTRNQDSISIECCYLAEDGSFTQETYDSLIALLQWLVEVYDLDVDEDILRHYDCGGKKCPIYYVENEDAWIKLKSDVKNQ